MNRSVHALPNLGVRAALTSQERSAVQVFRSSKQGVRDVLTIGSTFVAFVASFLLIIGSLHAFTGQHRDGGGWVFLALGLGLLLMVLPLLWLVRRNSRRVAADLALGEKILFDGVVRDRACSCSRGLCSYAIRVVASSGKGPGRFAVPERVFKGLSEGEAVRCAYLPASRILLALDAAWLSYALGDPV